MVKKFETAFGGTLTILGLGIIAFNNFFQSLEFIKSNSVFMVYLTAFILSAIIFFMLGGI